MVNLSVFKAACLLLTVVASINAEETKISRSPPIICNTPSIHVLIASIGRTTLMRMLESLEPQLRAEDYLTVVFDAVDRENIYAKAAMYLKKFKCKTKIVMESKNLGFWGHGIRNKHNQLPGNFILHGDDDDIYTPDAMQMIRKHCRNPYTLYIFKMVHNLVGTLWKEPKIQPCGIGTPMGVIPSNYNSKAVWGAFYGGDYAFYTQLQTMVPKVEFIDVIIYKCR